ncbi:hypothetical protein [Paracoccus chinensis]|nr:hypothetical protein [Paracoccus chinensis]
MAAVEALDGPKSGLQIARNPLIWLRQIAGLFAKNAKKINDP